MTELRDELRRASRAVEAPETDVERMLRRGEIRRRNARIGTAGLALGLTVAVLGGALFGLSRLGGTGTGRPGEGGGSDLAMAEGDYFYSRVVHVSSAIPHPEGGLVSEDVNVQIETWWGLDNSGRIETARESPGYGAPDTGTFGAGKFPITTNGATDVSHLSTDPVVLRRQLEERSTPAGASPQPDSTPGPGQTPQTPKVLKSVMFMLEWPNVTPELRAALFQVAAGLETVERTDGVQDPGGRDATRLSITVDDTDIEMYFDTDSGQWMATVETFNGHASYLIAEASGFVGSTDGPPTREDLFFPEPQRELPTP